MKIFTNIKKIQTEIKKIKAGNMTIGFVPTMGALHKGHLSLVQKARRENDIVVLSVFVNPMQFGKNEDFSKYPRDLKKDKLLAQKEKVDIIFYPSDLKMYPKGYLTYVNVEEMNDVLCGKSRPGHFKGVTTIVCKLMNIVCPDNIYLGQKDAQQAIIITKMIQDLNFPTKVRICPTVRENDGLAFSSRNIYLSPKQREEAPVLYRSLKLGKKMIISGQRHPKKIINIIRSNIENNSSGKIDYVECLKADTLKDFGEEINGTALLALAVKFGSTRLIDNLTFSLK